MEDLAIKKLDAEEKSFSGDRYAKIMYKDVAKALREFCRQQPEFAQAVYQSEKTLSDCIKAVAKNCGNGISDIEAYRRAVQFYFDGAQVEFQMIIHMSRYDIPSEGKKQNAPGMVIDLMDFL